MSDYIKREDAIKAIREIYDNAWDAVDADDMFRDGLLEARDAVMLVQSADVMPVRHGRWIKSKAGGVLCSECYSYAPNVEKGSFTTRRIEQEKSAYCPNCGARMDGDNDECK